MEATWPCGRPVRIRWTPTLGPKGKYSAQTQRSGTGMLITMSRRRNRLYEIAIDTIIHEYVHCHQWGPARAELLQPDDHPPAFGALYWEILDRFHHQGGDEEASEY